MKPFQCDLQPQLQETHRTTQTGTTIVAKHIEGTKRPQPHPPHTRGTFHRRLQPLYMEKRKVSCSGFLPTTHGMQPSCSHSIAICKHKFKKRMELRTQEQPLLQNVAKHIEGTKRPQPHPPHTRGTFHRRLQPLSKQSPCIIHASSPLPFIITSHRHHFPFSPLPFVTTSRHHHFPSSPLPFLTTSHRHHFPSSPLPFLTTSHRHHPPSSPLPFITASLRHHFLSSPLPIVTTSLHHHFPSSPLPFLTTSLRHHFPSSPLPFLTTSLRHHFPPSPLPFLTTSLPHHFPIVTTSLLHHSPSSPLPFVTTSLPHHFPSSPPPFLTTPLHHHFPSSPLPFLTTSHRNHIPSSPPCVIASYSFVFVLLDYVLFCDLPPFIIVNCIK